MTGPADNADLELARRCLAGQRDAFAQIVARHQRVVYGVALRMLGDRDEADDAAQEAFVRAYAHLNTFKGDSGMRTWLVQIATRLCIDRLRARQRRAEVSLEDRANPPVAPAWEGAVAERHALAQAVAGLPARYKAAIVLRHLQHMSYADLARTLGVPMATAKTHLRRARRLLRARLEGACAEAPPANGAETGEVSR